MSDVSQVSLPSLTRVASRTEVMALVHEPK